MRFTLVTICLVLLAGPLFAQGDRGAITGTVSDPAGVVVSGAASSRLCPPYGAESPCDAGNLRAAGGELVLKAFEAAVEVVDAVDHGLAFGGQRGDDEGH